MTLDPRVAAALGHPVPSAAPSRIAFVDVEGAGHMVAGDRNDLFADAVLDFLARHQVAKP